MVASPPYGNSGVTASQTVVPLLPTHTTGQREDGPPVMGRRQVATGKHPAVRRAAPAMRVGPHGLTELLRQHIPYGLNGAPAIYVLARPPISRCNGNREGYIKKSLSELADSCPPVALVYGFLHAVPKYSREVIDRVRLDEAKQQNTAGRRFIKDSRYLLLKNPENLRPPSRDDEHFILKIKAALARCKQVRDEPFFAGAFCLSPGRYSPLARAPCLLPGGRRSRSASW